MKHLNLQLEKLEQRIAPGTLGDCSGSESGSKSGSDSDSGSKSGSDSDSGSKSS